MDLTVAKTKTKIKNTGMTYVSIFGLTLLLGLVKIYDTSLCFVLPMLVVSFMCGYRHIIMYMTALLLVSQTEIVKFSKFSKVVFSVGFKK